MKILSINVWSGGFNRRERLLENIKKVDPDIVILGDFWHTKKNGTIPLMNMLKAEGWHHQYYPEEYVRYAVGIASKIPAANSRSVFGEYPAKVITVEIPFPSGSGPQLTVVGAYLPYFPSKKMRPLWEKLYRYLTELNSENHRFILAGDLNLCRETETDMKQYTLDIFEKCCTDFRDIGQQDPKPTHWKTNAFRLDYMISNLALKQLTGYSVHDSFLDDASDHCGISAEILPE